MMRQSPPAILSSLECKGNPPMPNISPDASSWLFEREAEMLEPADKAALAHWLARTGRSDGLRVMGLMGLLSSGRDELGLDLLSWAARGGDEACLLLAGELCLAGSADKWGAGPLHHWCEVKKNGGGAGAQILLALKADPTARDQWGLMPMHWSRDATVWAWSMAALWGRGDPNGWMECRGVEYGEVARRLGNSEFAAWVDKSGSVRRPTAFGGAPMRGGDAGEQSWGEQWEEDMRLRLLDLQRVQNSQELLAREVGL